MSSVGLNMTHSCCVLLCQEGACSAGSPSGGGKHHSGHSSVGDPIHLGSQEATAPASSMPAAPVSKAEAAANPRQQHPEVSVQHRLGKATPVKKTFTPRPSRFRLEAERPSVTPPDKSSGLEKVLFRSPAKAGKAPRQAQQLPCEDAIDCIGPGSSHQDVQPMDADCAQAAPQLQNEAQPPRPTPEAGDDGCEMVTPANQLHGGGQAVAHGVFAHMRVILDPELAAEESDRCATRHFCLMQIPSNSPVSLVLSRCLDPAHFGASCWPVSITITIYRTLCLVAAGTFS